MPDITDPTNQNLNLNPVNQQTTPTAPQNPIPGDNPSKFPRIFVVVITSVVFLVIAGYTGYLYINNQKELNALNDEDYSPAENAPSPTTQQDITTNEPVEIAVADNVVCARFTSLENALEHIEQACILDLSSQNHNNLPENIDQLTNLNEIDLSDNNLTDFPAELFGIDTLMSVDLSNNNISSIPENFVIPDNIQNLNLSGNPITSSELSKYSITPDTAFQE